MKFKFYPKESKLHDFLGFPRLLFYKEAYEESRGDYSFKDITMDEYLDFVQRVEEKLKPFLSEIEIYYSKPFLNDYNFIDLITRMETIFGYRDEKEFLYSLLNLKENEINNSIVTSLILINEEN